MNYRTSALRILEKSDHKPLEPRFAQRIIRFVRDNAAEFGIGMCIGGLLFLGFVLIHHANEATSERLRWMREAPCADFANWHVQDVPFRCLPAEYRRSR